MTVKMDKKEFEAMAYTDPSYHLTPPHEREILNRMASRRSYMAPQDSPPLRLLSLDGGGVKGYSSLLLLQEVMYRLFVEINGRPPQMHEIPLPCDHFDLIGGVGTGGLIALMLGRLRMDIETCKETWVRMTKRVFETDKTIVGIPYKTTFFKASKLESAIKEIVKEYTEGEDVPRPQHKKNLSGSFRDKSGEVPSRTRNRSDSLESSGSKSSPRGDQLKKLAEEGQDGGADDDSKFGPLQRYNSQTTGSSILGSILGRKLGNPESLLYDPREDRCKTFVAAMYQNSPEGTPPCLLRTYLSLTTLNPEPNCKIWEAGRATAATLTGFKPIQIGQTVFLDEGAGRYNITPMMLEEATCNEWPGRAVGCILSIGTGKPPPKKAASSPPWWENKIHTPFDNFTEARKRLIFKTHASEDIHQMLLGGGANGVEKWGIQRDNYIRLNVDIGVGDFAMNDWQRLADISTNTRRWLTSPEGKRLVGSCATKMAAIWRAKHMPLPPKSPLRTMTPMAELPVDSYVYHGPIMQEPFQTPITSPVDTVPQPPSRNQSRSLATDRTPTTGASTAVAPTRQPSGTNTRTIQMPMPHPQSLRGHYVRSSSEESHTYPPRPLAIQQRSQTTANLGEKAFDKQQYLNIQAGAGMPKQGPRRAMTEVRPNPPYPDD